MQNNYFLLPAFFLYWEILFSIGVFGKLTLTGAIPTILFCCSLCCFLQLLVNLFPGKGRQIAQQFLLIIAAVPYGVEYFVFRQFKVLYNVPTIINGAGGVVTGFLDDALHLIFSPSGILFLLLLLTPAILHRIFGFHVAETDHTSPRFAAVWLCFSLAFYFLGWGSTRLSELTWNVYNGDAYNFETGVQYFGLYTGIRLDLQYLAGRSTPVEFDTAQTQSTVSAKPTAEVQGSTTASYRKNKLSLPLEQCPSNMESLAAFVSTQDASSKNAYTGIFSGKNLILITAEAFTAEVIDSERTPTLYRLATSGIQFTDYYQPASAGTTGGEVLNLLGLLPTEGGSSMTLATSHYVLDLQSFLTPLGYTGGVFHNNSFTFYKRNITHNLLGYPNGFLGIGNGLEERITDKSLQRDLELFHGTLPEYLEQDQPFSLYYMTYSGHSVYNWSNRIAALHRSETENLPYSDTVNAYLACQMELEYALQYVVEALEASGKANDTVIVLSSDHFPYGLDDSSALGSLANLSNLYGYPVNNRLERDHNRLIIWSGCLEQEEPITVDSPTSSLDILPTLCNLFGVNFDSRLMVGRDAFSDREALVFNLNYEWKTELGTYFPDSGFTPASADTQIPTEYVERINTTVKNKISYCKGVLNCDFFGALLE